MMKMPERSNRSSSCESFWLVLELYMAEQPSIASRPAE